MSDLQARLKSLTPDQIRRLMAQRSRAVSEPEAMSPAADGSLPASLAQERFWFLSRLYPDTPDYNIPLAVLVNGPQVDLATLQRNLDAVIAGQEILRTTFHERDGKVVQVIHPSLWVKIAYEDRSAEYAQAGHALVEQLAVEHGAIVFAVDTLPLLAVKLVKLAPARHLVMLNLHHLISDGWSNSLLSQSLSTPAHLPPPGAPARQYRHFVEHERAWLQGEECRAQLAFWQALLKEPPQPPVFSHRSEDGPVNAGGAVAVELPPDLCERIARHCSAQGRTPFQYYMGCFALLMTRYTGENDLIVGTPVVNRNQPQFLQTCGLFINTLPMRFRIDPRRSFADALGDCAQAIEACLARQEMPYAELVKHVQVNRSINENPLFNLHFAFQYFPHQKASSDFQLLAVDHGVGKFDLNCFVEISAAGNRLSLSYRRRAFERVEIEQMAAEYVRVLELGLAPPGGVLGSLELISPAALSTCEGPCAERPGGNWYALFDKAARQWPLHAACVDAQGSVTYAELSASVERVSAALASRGVRRRDRVILRAPRDRGYVIGLLACMRLGASYIPLSIDAPPALEEQVQAEAGASLVLGGPGAGKLPCLAIVEACAHPAEHPVAPAECLDQDVAYVVYTSGSTGTPKGVAVTHEGLINYTLSLLERLGQAAQGEGSPAAFAHLSALDADLGNTAIFPALASGSALLVPDAAALLDGARLAAFFARHPADVAKMVPSHLRAMRPHLQAILPRRTLVCGGEALDAELVAAVRQAAPGLTIVNHYGPAEATIGVLTQVVPEASDPIPLGRPIANTRIHLVDASGRRVPRGRTGELCIEGPGLAAGYVEQPELTAASFVTPTFAPGARMYRSGDLAYVDGDGAIVFLGRRDNRVKIGGIMVQPEAIAGLLRQHEAVSAAHVWTQRGDDGNARLMAAVVPSRPVELVDLREHLLRHYKPAQCPALALLPELPLNANGKVDTHALRRACAEQACAAPSELPRDALELRLQALFRQVLGTEVPTLDAGFFDLGGTSLQAITLMGRINETFSLKLPITVLFEAGSVQRLAEVVRREGRGEGSSPVVTLTDAGQDEVVVWIHPAGGNAMCYLPVARALAPRRASMAISALGQPGEHDIPALARDYYERIRHEFPARRVVLAGWSMGALIAHEMALLATEQGHETRLMLLDQPVPDASAMPADHTTAVCLYLEKVEVFTGQSIGTCLDPAGNIDYGLALGAFLRLGLVPPDTREASLRGFLDLLVYHNAIIHAFRPGRLEAPALLLKAAEQVRMKHQPAADHDEPDLGWGRHCANLTTREVGGNHMTMLNRGHVEALAECVDAWLSQRP